MLSVRALLPMIVVALLGLVPIAEAQDRRESTCAMRGSETIRATERVRVFSSARGGYYACRYGERPVRLPGYRTEDASPQRFSVVGNRVAYAFVRCDRSDAGTDGCSSTVLVVDLLRRRIRRSAVFGKHGGVGSLVLSQAGSVAFVLRPIHTSLADNVTRVVVMRGTTAEVVDSGDEIAPDSLALGGRTLYWLKAGLPARRDLP
jgi:hypothetical protein